MRRKKFIQHSPQTFLHIYSCNDKIIKYISNLEKDLPKFKIELNQLNKKLHRLSLDECNQGDIKILEPLGLKTDHLSAGYKNEIINLIKNAKKHFSSDEKFIKAFTFYFNKQRQKPIQWLLFHSYSRRIKQSLVNQEDITHQVLKIFIEISKILNYTLPYELGVSIDKLQEKINLISSGEMMSQYLTQCGDLLFIFCNLEEKNEDITTPSTIYTNDKTSFRTWSDIPRQFLKCDCKVKVNLINDVLTCSKCLTQIVTIFNRHDIVKTYYDNIFRLHWLRPFIIETTSYTNPGMQPHPLSEECGCAEAYHIKTAECDIVCSACGKIIAAENTIQTDGNVCIPYSDMSSMDLKSSSFAYKHIEYFKDLLNNIQGNTKISTDPEILDAVRNDLARNNYTYGQIDIAVVKNTMKKLKLSKYYSIASNIYYIITETSPLIIPDEIYNKLLDMFSKVLQCWSSKVEKGSRKSFLNYKYLFYKFSELLGLLHYTDCVILLKSDEKLRKQDALWESIILYLSEDDPEFWKFIPTI